MVGELGVGERVGSTPTLHHSQLPHSITCPLTNSEQNGGAVNQNGGLLGAGYCAFALCLQGARFNCKLFLICYKMPVVISLCRGAFCLSGHSTQRLGRLFLIGAMQNKLEFLIAFCSLRNHTHHISALRRICLPASARRIRRHRRYAPASFGVSLRTSFAFGVAFFDFAADFAQEGIAHLDEDFEARDEI